MLLRDYLRVVWAVELVMFRFQHGDVSLSILSVNGKLWGRGEHLRIGAYEPSAEIVCFINNTRGLQQRERAQLVVSGGRKRYAGLRITECAPRGNQAERTMNQ